MICRAAALIALLGLTASASQLGVQRIETRAVAALRRAAAINFGTCSNPEIQDVNGVFSPVNTAEFGSVAPSTNLDDVVLGVCNVLATSCGVDGVTKGDCSTAASDAIGVGNTAAADDEFNSVLGITTDFASTAAAAVAAAASAPPAASVETIVTTIVSTIITTIEGAAATPAASASFTGAAAAATNVKGGVKAASQPAKAAPAPKETAPAAKGKTGTKGKPARL